jgi:hypothetical protein
MDAALAAAKKSYGKLRLQQAKAAVAARGSEASKVSSIDREGVRSKLDAMRSGARAFDSGCARQR